MLPYYCAVKMLHQEESTHNTLEKSNKSCSKMWEPLLWFRIILDLKIPHLKPKKEPLEYRLLMEKRKICPLFCCCKWYLSSFLNQISNIEVLVFGKYQNYSCQHFHLFFLVSYLVSLFVSANIICWINIKFNNCSDQTIYWWRKVGS